MVDGKERALEPAESFTEREGVRILVPLWTKKHTDLRAAVSTRVGGVSRDPFGMNTSFRVGDDEGAVRANRERFFRAGEISGGMLATAGQVHGSDVVVAGRPGHYADCDGLVTDTKGLFLGVSVADCVPIMLYDANKKVVGIVHSGWRGSRGKIADTSVRLMEERFSCRAADLHAYIGPSAGGCCYEVGDEVADHFPAEALKKTGTGKYLLDLGTFNRNLLVGCGVPEAQIAVSERCTIHEGETFHSHRRDREGSGRMLAVIGIIE
ncbi:MAG TPA: peptidoglycan editing factor PgeF [Bacteroidota bacterium]|nr:peptidoglycan editing factor PgeF [Bacteroidota bacterium]